MRRTIRSLSPVCFAFIALAGTALFGCGASGGDESSAVPEEAGMRAGRCGDGVCGRKETCSSCPADCGVCSGSTASASSSTSGSGGATSSSSSSTGSGGTSSSSTSSSSSTASSSSSTGGGTGQTITAASCAQTDVQQAVDAAANGDTVIVPVGTCTWNAGITTSKQITIAGQSKGGVKLVMGPGIATYDTALFHITTGGAYSTVISNLQFWPGGGVGMYILVDGSVTDQPPLIHDDFFSSKDHSFFTFITYRRYGGGVIFNNTFQSTSTSQQYFGSGGIQIKDGGGDASWSAPSTMGAADVTGLSNVYIEDNTFTNVGVFDADDGSRVVFRHNVLNDAPMATHGADTSWIGLRHLEIYDNEFYFHASGTWTLKDISGNSVSGSYPLNLNGWSDWRGGTGVITGNYIENISSSYWGDKSEFRFQIQQSDRSAGPDACCPEGYACYHQIGRGMNNGAEPIYVWGNTGYSPAISIENSGYGQCPNNPNENNPGYYLQLNRDYYKGTAKPGWSRYTYPHPLR